MVKLEAVMWLMLKTEEAISYSGVSMSLIHFEAGVWHKNTHKRGYPH